MNMNQFTQKSLEAVQNARDIATQYGTPPWPTATSRSSSPTCCWPWWTRRGASSPSF